MKSQTKTDEPRCWAVIPAAGSGRRMGGQVAKQYLELAGLPVIHWAIKPFSEEPRVAGIVVVLASGDRLWAECAPRIEHKLLLTTQGGSDRARSVRNGLAALAEHAAPKDWILVHDAARPCLSGKDLHCLLAKLWDDPVGGLLAAPVRDTLKREIHDSGCVAATVSRADMWLALTPQMFRYQALCDALDAAITEGATVTDESAAIERSGVRPHLVESRPHNLKITYPQDLLIAERMLERA